MRLLAFTMVAVSAGCGSSVPGFPMGSGSGESGPSSESSGSGTTGTTTGMQEESGPTTVTTTASNDSADASSSSTTQEFKFDLGVVADVPHDQCDSGNGDGTPSFSYAWIANGCLSFESNCPNSAVSKIDTHSLVEVARYKTRADGMGNPSRTSVNLNGDMAVANRLGGGVTMIRARLEDCPDPTNTSTGPDDVKPWQDGCIEWFTPTDYLSQRPIAWTQGTFNHATCRWDDALVWVSGTTPEGEIEVIQLDGETGVLVDSVIIEGLGTGYLGMGLYGGAVDGEGNFWGNQLGDPAGDFGSLVRVKLSDMAFDTWPSPIPGYGMTVDGMGRAWICSGQTARFDPVAELFTVGEGNPDGGSGCMEDGNGSIWIAGRSIVAVDLEDMNVVASYLVPTINGDVDTGYTRGISFDYEGYIWSPAHWANRAYRVDPGSGEFEYVEGLDFPYTYSDMTGFALSNAGSPAG
jgi:hypothetical protein